MGIELRREPVTELVRRDVLKVLNRVDDIFGERPVLDVLAAIFGKTVIEDDAFGVLTRHSLKGQITQHFLSFSDWSVEELLVNCGALTCSQARFFRLLEEVLHPTTRRDEEQTSLAEWIGQALARSGFTIRVTGSDAGYPIFGIVRLQDGVAGAMKNLIFASVGASASQIQCGNPLDLHQDFLHDVRIFAGILRTYNLKCRYSRRAERWFR